MNSNSNYPLAPLTSSSRWQRWETLPTHRFPRSVLRSWLLLWLVLTIGCVQQTELPPPKTPAKATAKVALPANPLQNLDSDSTTLLETWDAVYMGGTKIGSIHTVLESIERNDRTMLKGSSLSKLEIQRFGQKASLQTSVTSLESEQGEVESFLVQTSVGPTPLTVEGVYRDGAMQLITTSQGKRVTGVMPWKTSHGGFFALEQSLSKQPMKPGETRTLTTLIPGVAGVQLVETRLEARQVETVDMLDGDTQKLLNIAMTSQIGGQDLDSVCWTTTSGDVLKSSVPALQQTIYRTSQTRAQAAESGDYDLGRDSIVKVSPPLPHPHQLTRTVLIVSLDEKDPAKIFTSGDSQQVIPINSRQARVTILAVRPGSPISDAKDPAPGPDDLQPNSLIQSDDTRIVKLAQQWAGTGGPWDKCVSLEKAVHDAIRAKNFGQGFATAADVARSLEGDCTEHAVLLAALCRAEGIPARVALGLVYSARDQGFAFHMWDEAWVTDRWIPLDATLGQGGIGAAHLKLGHSTLAREAAESAAFSVIQVIHQLKIKVADFQPH